MARKEGNPDWEFGYEAYCNHEPRDSNPKPEGSQAYDDWTEGWDCADSDIDDEVYEDPCNTNSACDCNCVKCSLNN